MVEFALVLPLFLLLAFGTIDFGRVIFSYSEVVNAVREGARVARIKCGTASAEADARAAVVATAPTVALAGAPTVTYAGGCAPPNGQVTVSARFQFAAVSQTFLGITPLELEASARAYAE